MAWTDKEYVQGKAFLPDGKKSLGASPRKGGAPIRLQKVSRSEAFKKFAKQVKG